MRGVPPGRTELRHLRIRSFDLRPYFYSEIDMTIDRSSQYSALSCQVYFFFDRESLEIRKLGFDVLFKCESTHIIFEQPCAKYIVNYYKK